jgi:outer membrane protein OmpA-like peptidoglycan-associated protein
MSFWRYLTLFLLLALIGGYFFYDWYDGRLVAQLAEKDTRIAQSSEQVQDTGTRLQQTEHERDSVRSELVTHDQACQSDKSALMSQVATLEQDLATRSLALTAEQQKTAQLIDERNTITAAHDELERLYEADKIKSVSLKLDLDKMQQAILDTAAEHQAKVAELEHHINERIRLATTTPMDAELLRTAQSVGVLPPAPAESEAPPALAGQLAEATSQLALLQSDAAAAQTQLADVQQQLEQARADLEQSTTRLDEANATHASAMAEAARQLAELTQESRQHDRSSEVAALNERLATEQKVCAALQQQHQAAIIALTDRLDETQQTLTTLRNAAQTATDKAAQSDLGQAESVNDRIKSLEASLEAERRQAAAAQQSIRAEADKSLAKLRALYAGFADLGGTYTPHGLLLRIMETELRFTPGQATLPDGNIASLDRIAALLLEQPELTVRIEGHTDRLGGDELNLSLSQQRAEAVRQSLIARGIDATRLTAAGIGAARPIADNATANGRSQNRRVEVYVEE